MIIRPSSLSTEFQLLSKGGHAVKTLSTGFEDLDLLIKLAKGYMMVGTGYPSSGKSEFFDAMMLNMSIMHGWKTLYFSPENYPTEEHMGKLAEKFVGKNLRSFTTKDTTSSLEFLEEYFTWMYPDNPTINEIFRIAEAKIVNGGLDCLIIDPWNNILHDISNMREDQYLSVVLSRLIKFARVNNIFVGIIAHPKNPQKQADGTYPFPDLYCISGGAMWRNKIDYGVCFHRPDMGSHILDVSVQKIKYKWMGKVGKRTFDYDVLSGRFKGQKEIEFTLPNEIASPF
jgi:twinkle protein